MFETWLDTILVYGVIAGLVLLLVVAVKAGAWLDGSGQGAVGSRSLLTGNEIEFLGRLRRALPDFEVLPQISMGALIQVNLPEAHPSFWQLRRKFGMKVVDFVVCKKGSFEVIAAVELDDRTHDSKQSADAQRDKILLAAGIPTVRWDSRNKPNLMEIKTQIQALVGGDKRLTI